MKMNEEVDSKSEEILKNSDSLEFILNTVQMIHKGDKEEIILAYLCGLTPFIETDQLHLINMGKSGKGKSDLFSKVLLVFPEETYKMLTSVSPKALHYGKKDKKLIPNGIIYIDESEASKDAIPILRAITSSGRIRPEHWTIDEKRKFVDLKLEGKYSIWLSSVNPLQDDQLKNRFLFMNVDESKEIDEEVWKHQDQLYRKGGEKKSLHPDFLVAQTITKKIISVGGHVKIPYTIEWFEKDNRRLYPFFLTLVKASTIAHLYQREQDLDGCWIATRYDFELTLQIWSHIFEYMKKRVNEEAISLLQLIPENKDDAVTRVNLSELSVIPSRRVKYLTGILVEEGLINWDILDTKGRPNVYWKVPVADCRSVAKVDWSNFKIENLTTEIQLLRQKPENTELANRIYNSIMNSAPTIFCRRDEEKLTEVNSLSDKTTNSDKKEIETSSDVIVESEEEIKNWKEV
jgi:hypothetical protein